MMNTGPLNPEQLEWLDEVFLEHGNADSILNASELDGFLTALVSGPEPTMPSRWYPALWGGADKVPDWKTKEQMESFMALVFQHMNDNAFRLMDCPDEFDALFMDREFEGKVYTLVDEWCVGYMRGVQLSGDAWKTAPEKLLAEHLEAINLFADEMFDDQLDQLSDQEIEQRQQKVEPAARALHAYWLSQRKPGPAAVPVTRGEPKISRNDPCPCGSGKKYKKCCLH